MSKRVLRPRRRAVHMPILPVRSSSPVAGPSNMSSRRSSASPPPTSHDSPHDSPQPGTSTQVLHTPPPGSMDSSFWSRPSSPEQDVLGLPLQFSPPMEEECSDSSEDEESPNPTNYGDYIYSSEHENPIDLSLRGNSPDSSMHGYSPVSPMEDDSDDSSTRGYDTDLPMYGDGAGSSMRGYNTDLPMYGDGAGSSMRGYNMYSPIYGDGPASSMRGYNVDSPMYGDGLGSSMRGYNTESPMYGDGPGSSMRGYNTESPMYGDGPGSSMRGYNTESPMYGDGPGSSMRGYNMELPMYGDGPGSSMRGYNTESPMYGDGPGSSMRGYNTESPMYGDGPGSSMRGYNTESPMYGDGPGSSMRGYNMESPMYGNGPGSSMRGYNTESPMYGDGPGSSMRGYNTESPMYGDGPGSSMRGYNTESPMYGDGPGSSMRGYNTESPMYGDGPGFFMRVYGTNSPTHDNSSRHGDDTDSSMRRTDSPVHDDGSDASRHGDDTDDDSSAHGSSVSTVVNPLVAPEPPESPPLVMSATPPEVQVDMPLPLQWGPSDPNEVYPDRLYDVMKPFVATFREDQSYAAIIMKWESDLIINDGDIFVGKIVPYSVELVRREASEENDSDCEILDADGKPVPSQPRADSNINISTAQTIFREDENNKTSRITIVKKFMREGEIGLTEVYRVFLDSGPNEIFGPDGRWTSFNVEVTAAIKIHSGPIEANIRGLMPPFIQWLYTMERKFCRIKELLQCEFGARVLCANGGIVQSGSSNRIKLWIWRLYMTLDA